MINEFGIFGFSGFLCRTTLIMFHFNLIIMKKVLTQVIHNGAKVLMSLHIIFFSLCLVMNLGATL